MEVYQEVLDTCQSVEKNLKKCNINNRNIENCLYKLNGIKKDLEQINYFIRDLQTTADTRAAGQATNKCLCKTTTTTPQEAT